MQTDVLVIGSGIAGVISALRFFDRHHIAWK